MTAPRRVRIGGVTDIEIVTAPGMPDDAVILMPPMTLVDIEMTDAGLVAVFELPPAEKCAMITNIGREADENDVRDA